MLTQPNLSFDSFEKVKEKKSDLYMSDVLFMWFSDSKTYKGILHFGKRKKLGTKEVFMRHIIFAMFWKATYICYARFRFRREIHNQLPSLERFLETISSI